jgi:hypothetical protein
MTMTEKICPVCNRPNLSTATRCWYCQSVFDDVPDSTPAGEGQPAESQNLEEAQAVEESEVPEWLKRIRQRKAIEEMQHTPSLPPEAPSPEEEAGTFANLRSEPLPFNQDQSTSLPTQLQGLETSDTAAGVTRSLEPEKVPGGERGKSNEPEEVDWLEKLRAWKARDEEETQPEETAPIPDQAAEEATQAAPELQPDAWLKDFLSPTPEEPEISPEVEPIANGESTPKAMQPIEVPGEAPKTLDETYDFTIEDQAARKVVQPPAESVPETQSATLESNPPPESANELPEILQEASIPGSADLDWLTHYQEKEPEELPEAVEPSTPQEEPTQPQAPFLGVQKSDWAEKIAQPEAKAQEEAEEEVEPGVLPQWMENLRPLETIPQGINIPPSEPEQENPLAGIAGILEGTGLGGAFEKPPVYSNKIGVTDRQSARADLFQKLVAEPEEVKAAAEAVVRGRSKWLRNLVSLTLLVAVFAVLIMAPGTSLLPVLYPPETAKAYQWVNSLTADKPVLIAADYESGLSDEIALTSHAMVEHLMLRNIPIALLSTNAVGTTLMEGILNQSQARITSYDLANRVVNFGYLAGGSVGIQSLTADLPNALPFDVALNPAWTNPLLQNVHSLSDLGAVVVVTDDADTGRYWVEQISSSLNGVPLILVTSAQAAPMLQTYYASGQVSAVVAGISGGSAYEQIMQLQGNSSYLFGSYQALTLLVAALIFVGGVVSLIRPASNRKKG